MADSQKTVEQLLEELNQLRHLALIYDTVSDLVFFIRIEADGVYRYVSVNQSYCKTTGLISTEVIGKKVEEILPEPAARFAIAQYQQAIASKKVLQYGELIDVPTGQIALETTLTPILDDAGNCHSLLGVAHNITEKREAQERLRLSLEAGQMGIWEWNIVTNAVYWSENVELIYGIASGTFAGTFEAFLEIVHSEDLPGLQQEIARVVQHETEYSFEFRILWADQSQHWIWSKGRVHRDTKNQALRMMGVTLDITDRKQTEERLVYNALHDNLTGLPNRVLFMDRLEQAIKRYQRHPDKMFAVIFLDLDRFKMVNDSLGHAVGDQFLVEIGQRLRSCLRASDTLARLGGDEFAVLLEEIHHLGEVETCAIRFQERLAAPFYLRGQEVFASASLGIALSSGQYEQSGDLLRDADIAMYQAKQHGRGCYQVFNPQMYRQAVDLLNLQQDLHRALERQQFQVYYQAIVSLPEHKLVGFEALVRWQHPQRGILTPGEFLFAAEESGLIVNLDWWVLKEACRQMVFWLNTAADTSPLTLSVNLSSQQFTHTDTVRRIAQILEETNLDPRCLKLEITETVMMESENSGTAALMQLRDLQVQLNIDEFGTGYSSLSRLHRFPIDALKIARLFVNRLGTRDQNLEVIRAIITLGHNLGMDVIAEGVETWEQAEILQELGCKYAQGYLFSEPQTAAQTEILLHSLGSERIFPSQN